MIFDSSGLKPWTLNIYTIFFFLLRLFEIETENWVKEMLL